MCFTVIPLHLCVLLRMSSMLSTSVSHPGVGGGVGGHCDPSLIRPPALHSHWRSAGRQHVQGHRNRSRLQSLSKPLPSHTLLLEVSFRQKAKRITTTCIDIVVLVLSKYLHIYGIGMKGDLRRLEDLALDLYANMNLSALHAISDCLTLCGCSTVWIGKNIANYPEIPRFCPVICALCTNTLIGMSWLILPGPLPPLLDCFTNTSVQVPWRSCCGFWGYCSLITRHGHQVCLLHSSTHPWLPLTTTCATAAATATATAIGIWVAGAGTVIVTMAVAVREGQ